MEAKKKHADELTSLVLTGYLKHHELVFKKLGHAQSATREKLTKVGRRNKKEIDNLENLWDEILILFKDYAASEGELFKIENTLGQMPEAIKQLYLRLVENDKIIDLLIDQMDRERYLKGIKTIASIQAKPNPLSGLSNEDYDQEDIRAQKNSDAVTYAPYLNQKISKVIKF